MSSSTSASTFSRPSAGSHTVEGNKSGSRAAALEAERQQANEDFERKKQAAAGQRSKTTLSFKSTAASKGSVAEQTFRAKTVGLVAADDYVVLQQEASRQEDLLADELTLLEQQQELDEMARHPKEDKKARKKRKKEKKKLLSTLSFGDEIAAEDDAEENEETTVPTKKKSKSSLKDPTVDTSFLPDQQRDNAERAERIRLTREWKEAQKSQRETPLQVTYSYWDGTGHRKTVVTKQGNSISEFLQLVLDDLIPSFRQLAGLTADDLMYVKEDLILPSDLTFYDLIATKARGKSGPLFSFDVHDDIRIGPNDVRVEKDDSHPGKVVERRWYERSKHIFPASRWEVYESTKDYGSYTIGGKIVQSDKKK